ncbi:hypothetical protein [Pontibacter rugosus]|uniref:Uncharacterized protein n=1 Tax=Pontibacter rugosus TaxID=1745966 RepID=A0ABW3SNK8_9BACT
MQPENELKKYYTLTKKLEDKGGPEQDTDLFEEVLWQEQQILASFGLPNSDKYRKILWEITYNDGFKKKTVQDIIKQLQQAAEKHLLAPVHTAVEMLRQAQREQLSAFDVLPELGLSTHVYTLYLYEQLLLKQEATSENILQELEKASDLNLLDKIGKMVSKEQPRRTKAYRELKESLPYLDSFIEYTLHAEEEEKDEEEEPSTPVGNEGESIQAVPFLLSHPIVVERIICIEQTNISMVIKTLHQGHQETYTLGLHVKEFEGLMSLYEPFGEQILTHCAHLAEESNTEELTYEIDLEEELGQRLLIDQHYLQVYAPQIRDERGRLEENRFGFVMLHEVIEIPEESETEQGEELALNLLSGHLKHVQAWYGFYVKKLESLNSDSGSSLSSEEKELIARNAAGLQDDKLFELSRQLYELYSKHHIDFELRKKQ